MCPLPACRISLSWDCWQGAGKSTTLRMLTGDETPSAGTAELAGLDILKRQEEVRQMLGECSFTRCFELLRIAGSCPQFDCLIETLTGRETLEMYARIKVRNQSAAMTLNSDALLLRTGDG